MSEEVEPPEPIKQFENFTTTFIFPVDYTNSPANTEFVDVTFSRFRQANLNITIPSNTVTAVRTFPVPVDFGSEESGPDIRDAFQFVISGFFGEELATNDEYKFRKGDDVITVTSFGDLPDFNEANTFMIKFFPDSRHSVFVSFEFTTNATPANTFATGGQEFELVPDRHLSRILAIGETIETRAALEREEFTNRTRAEVNSLTPNFPGKQ